MSKLSFRARALDPSKPMPIYLAEELPDLPEYSAINRAVPQMPSGMEKEEESEHHLQRAICAGLIIPTPEVFETEREFYERSYPNDYKMPRQLIHMQPLNLEQDIPEYDMDSADESWVKSQNKRLDLSHDKFEQMMDRLEKSSGQTVVTLNEAKTLLKQDDEVSIAVYDYWLHKRLKTQHPLILTVKTENRGGIAGNSPYLAFRRRTEKMQTRKNRKNDEASYEKMLKLRRDLSRAVTLLEMIKKREKTKREQLHLTIEVVEKRYQARDFSGQLQAEYLAQVAKSTTRPAFAPLYSNQYSHLGQSPQHQWSGVSGGGVSGLNHGSGINKRDLESLNGSIGSVSRKEKRQYKKRKHKHTQREKQRLYSSPGPAESMVSSEDDDLCNAQASESEDEGPYGFKRNRSCQYNMPTQNGFGNWPWTSRDENGAADPRYRFTLTSLAHPRPRCIGFARRRIGRGGRVIIDRMSTDMDELWSRLDYKIFDSARETGALLAEKECGDGESNGVVAAIGESSTQKRLLEIELGTSGGRSSGSNINRSTSSNGTAAPVAGAPKDVIKSEHVASTTAGEVVAASNISRNPTSDSVNLNKVLDRHSNNLSTGWVANQNHRSWSASTDRLSSASSGYLSQQSLTATASLGAADLDAVQVVGADELPRSLSMPTGGAFRDVSGTPAVLRRSDTVQDTNTQEWESMSVDNEDDMSLAELARKSGPTTAPTRAEQTEDEVFAMIRKEWLHFRPQPSRDSERNCLPKLSSFQPLDLAVVTLQTQDSGHGDSDLELPSSVFLSSDDHVFHPQPFSLDDIDMRGSPTASQMSSSAPSPVTVAIGGGGLDQSLSGDSLNELSLNLGDDDTGEDNEKVLENILQECQMGDLKILEDPTIFTSLQDTEDEEVASVQNPKPVKNLFQRAVGYESEFMSWALESFGSRGSTSNLKRESDKKSLRSAMKRQRRVGKSKFQLSAAKKDESFSPEKESTASETESSVALGQSAVPKNDDGSGVVVMPTNSAQLAGVADGGVVTIKQEPGVHLEDAADLQIHEVKIEKQEESESEVATAGALMIPMSAAALQQQQQQRSGTATRNIVFPSGTNYLAQTQQGENTIILTSSVKSHLNGPLTDKSLVTATTPNKAVPFKRQHTPKLADGDLIMTTGLINNGGGVSVAGGQQVATNHKFSLTAVGGNNMSKTISIAGQPGSTGNKFYIHSTSLMNATQQQQQSSQQQQQITLTTSAGHQSGTKAVQYLTPANIKFNLMTTAGGSAGGGAGQAQDIKSILASQLPSNIIINDHPGNNIVAGSSPSAQGQSQTVTVQQQGQRPKTMNVFVDGEKRYLYTNNRGLVAQLNPTKMVNIVPVTGGAAGAASQQAAAGGLNSNTKVITTTTTKAVLEGSNRIIGHSQQPGRSFQTVQRLRTIRNSSHPTSQGQVVTATGAGGSEVRTFNRILIQSAPGAGTGTSVSIGSGDTSGGAGTGETR